MKQQYLLAIDQGTTSTRAILFTQEGQIAAIASEEHTQHHPQPGWVEHDAQQIWDNTCTVLQRIMAEQNLSPQDVAALGITNQRESVVLWDRSSGKAVTPVIVWQDQRTHSYLREHADELEPLVAETALLPLTSYFSASKVRWLLDHDPSLQERARTGKLCAGTMDSWLLFNLTQGAHHATDVTNASRTMLYNLEENRWDDQLLEAFDVPEVMLPDIRPSVGNLGQVRFPSSLAGVPIAAMLGDQQAAAFGQHAVKPGDTKNTYGTGCFLLQNTGTTIPASTHGLIPTVAFQLAQGPRNFALEGSIAVAGSGVQWLRDQLQFGETSQSIAELAASVPDTAGAYFVPAFSGLFAPYWDPRARGLLIGMTAYTSRAHIARAVIESTAFQSVDILNQLNATTGIKLRSINVDGGMAANDQLMQFQADLLNITVRRPQVIETTALGVALAAGLGVGLYDSLDSLQSLWQLDQEFSPHMMDTTREELLHQWAKAIKRSQHWLDD